MKFPRLFAICGSLFGFLGVAAGAFAAHGLKGRLTPEMMEAFETGARYQIYHAFALFIAAIVSQRFAGVLPRVAGFCFLLGTILFSGSLYLLALTEVKNFGMITPIGGLGFLAGWVCLALIFLKKPAG